VYALDLGSRKFVRLTDPYPTPNTAGNVDAYPQGIFPDGSAVPTHNYGLHGYHPATKTKWTLRGSGNLTNVTQDYAKGMGIGLQLDNLTWKRTPIAQVNGANATFNPSGNKACYDSVRDCFWVITADSSTGHLYKLSNITTQNGDGTYGTWSVTLISPPGDYQCSMEHEPVSDLLIWTSWAYATKRVYAYPLSKVIAGVSHGRRVLML
jgi:hypothetical protein